MKNAWVSSYNHRFRKFDNGICWYRFYVKIGGRWRTPGGVWFRLPDSHGGCWWRRLPGVRYLWPDQAKGPITAGKGTA